MREIATNFFHFFGRWRADKRASVTVLVAIMLLVFLGVCGLAVDFAMAYNARSRAESAADAAGLRALETVRNAVMTNQGDFESVQAQAEADGNAAFQAQLGTIPMGTLSSSSVVVNQDPATGSVTATVKYSGYVTTSFMKLFGVSRQGFANTVQTSTNLPKYVHITFLVDTSQSMGIGADSNAISTLFNDPNVQCGFACHDSGNSRTSGSLNWQLPSGVMTDDFWLYERCGGGHGGASSPVPMRIDFIRKAMGDIVTTLKTSSNIFTASALIFGTPAYPTVLPGPMQTNTCPDGSHIGYYGYATAPPAASSLAGSSLDTVSSMIPYIDTEDNTYVTQQIALPAGYPNRDSAPSLAFGYTQTTSVLQWLADNLPVSGSGVSPNSPIQVILLLSDGTEADPAGWQESKSGDTIPAVSECQMLTGGGKATLIVVDTAYPDLSGYDNSAYNREIGPIASQISSNLQSCASPGYYAQATSGAEIQSVATALVNKFQQSLAIAISR